jgi:O-antigen ligase
MTSSTLTRNCWPDGSPQSCAEIPPASLTPVVENRSALEKLGLVLLVVILVLHGTYLRSRENDSTGLDWVVMGRVLACFCGFGIGVLLLRRVLPLGFGAKALLMYGLAAVLSGLACPYTKLVIGYSILLLGVSLLTIALVGTAKSLPQLRIIETLWFATVCVLAVKDTIITRGGTASEAGADVSRLGMGSTHPCELSLLAVLLFWMSFGRGRGWVRVALWVLRAFLIYVLIAAETRTSLAAFVLAGMVRFLLISRDPLRRIVIATAAAGMLISLVLFNLYSSQSWAGDMLDYVKRGQDAKELGSFTGRTAIWEHVTNKMWETPILGHGYAVTRFTMGEPPNAGFQPMHCHNMMLEVFFSTGFVGLIPFSALLLYNLRWVFLGPRLQQPFSRDLALNGACVVVAILLTSLFESRLVVRLTLFEPLFFFYLITLDREQYFRNLRITDQRRDHDSRELLCAGHCGTQ